MPATLLIQFAIASAMLVACVVFHGLGLAALNKAMRSEASIERLRHIQPLSPRGAAFTRLLGAFESILGMILLGWSTAFFFRMLDRIDAD